MPPILAIDSFVELVSLVGSGGGAVAVIVVVILFLKHIREGDTARTEALEKIGKDWYSHHERLMNESHEHHEKLNEAVTRAIMQNSEVIRENTLMLGKVSAAEMVNRGMADIEGG